jgi:hypothetical protein
VHAFMRRHPSVSVTEPQVFQTWPGLYGLALVFTDVAPRTCVMLAAMVTQPCPKPSHCRTYTESNVANGKDEKYSIRPDTPDVVKASM